MPDPNDPTGVPTAMLSEFGLMYVPLSGMLSRVRLPEHAAATVREAATRGPVVYVLLQPSVLDHLALNGALRHAELPLSTWANAAPLWPFRPLGQLWAAARRWWRDDPDAEIQLGLARRLAAGESVTLFLGHEPAPGADPIGALIRAQAVSERPIQVLPVLLVWDRSPEASSAIRWWIEGSREDPARYARLRDLVLRNGSAFVQVGEPVDLRALTARAAERTAAGRPIADEARALRVALRRYLRRESNVVRGPRLIPHAQMKRMVLDNPPMRDLAAKIADGEATTPEAISRRMATDYDRLAARFSWWVIELLKIVLKPLWTRIYDGVDVRPDDLEKIRAAVRGGTAILTPSHKSHFDYLLLGWVFYSNGLIVPHVIAGMNLAIWPVSIILRGAGGFFVRRSFAGDKVFPAVFARYLRELVRHGWPVEFFIEGGRTRTGKLLVPKLGVLGMVFEAAVHRRRGDEVTVLPMALAYEQVAEERAYARELGGAKKEPETFGALVRARSVFRRRYGRVYLRVGEPIPLGPLVDTTPGWLDLGADERRAQLQHVANRVIYRIGLVSLVLPTSLVAMALLAHHRRGMRQTELAARVERLRATLNRLGALEAASLERASEATLQALARFADKGHVEALEVDGERVWAVPPDQRITLDFHKNQAVHHLAPLMFAVAALRALPDGPFTTGDLADGFAFVSHTMRREFVLDPDRAPEVRLEAAVQALRDHGAIIEDDAGRWSPLDAERLGELHGLFRSLLDSYRIVAAAVPILHGGLATEAAARLQADPGAGARPESRSIVALENAVASLREDGAFVLADGRIEDRPEARRALLARLDAMAGV